MFNWINGDKSLIAKAISAAMGEFESLIDSNEEICTANYWFDRCHNIFAITNNNGHGDIWLEIHYELYDTEENLIGDLIVLDTQNTSEEAIKAKVTKIVKMYYGE